MDGHVHIHHRFEVNAFFSAALANFRTAEGQPSEPDESPYVLMLTESAGANQFASLYAVGDASLSRAWRVRRTDETISLLVESVDGGRLILVAGRQIQVRGGLEVLALGAARHVPDGGDLLDTIQRVAALGAVPVVPWGFGKWWFGRGRQVRRVIEGVETRPLFVGDTSVRLRYGPQPRLFETARTRGIWTLAGTDPFPFPSHQGRAGRYGSIIDGAVDLDRPGSSVLRLLRCLTAQPRPYGSPAGLTGFVASQIAMQLRRRGPADPGDPEPL